MRDYDNLEVFDVMFIYISMTTIISFHQNLENTMLYLSHLKKIPVSCPKMELGY